MSTARAAAAASTSAAGTNRTPSAASHPCPFVRFHVLRRAGRVSRRERAAPLAGVLLPPNVPAGAGAPDRHGELCFPLKLGHPPMSSAAVYSLAIKAMEEASGLTSWTADAAASERESAAAICLV